MLLMAHSSCQISRRTCKPLYADSCVPDEYAQNSNVECFAQDVVVFSVLPVEAQLLSEPLSESADWVCQLADCTWGSVI